MKFCLNFLLKTTVAGLSACSKPNPYRQDFSRTILSLNFHSLICLYLLLVTLKWEASNSCRFLWNKTTPFYCIKIVEKAKKLSFEKQEVHFNYSGLPTLTSFSCSHLHSLPPQSLLKVSNKRICWLKQLQTNNRAANCSPLNNLQDLDCSLYKLLNIFLQFSFMPQLFTSPLFLVSRHSSQNFLSKI